MGAVTIVFISYSQTIFRGSNAASGTELCAYVEVRGRIPADGDIGGNCAGERMCGRK
jgi:hypothetical protein